MNLAIRTALPALVLISLASARAAEPSEAEAVAALEKLGAKMNVDNIKRVAERPVRGVQFPRKGCEITDDDLALLKALPTLEYVYIHRQKKVTGEGLKHLVSLKKLEVLDLDGSAIVSKHLVHLKDMKQLHKLGLWHTAVDDEGMVHLKGLVNLEHLYLEKTKVGDKGIEALGPNPSRCDVGTEGSLITEKGEAIMKKNFPRLGLRPLHGD